MSKTSDRTTKQLMKGNPKEVPKPMSEQDELRTLDDILEKGARHEKSSGRYGFSPLLKACPQCGGSLHITRKLLNQEDSVPVAICVPCDTAWIQYDSGYGG